MAKAERVELDAKKNAPAAQPPSVKVSSMPDQFFPKAEKKKISTGLVVVLAIVFLLIVGGVVFVISQTVTPPEQVANLPPPPPPPPPANLNQNLNLNSNANVNFNVNQNLNTNLNTNVPPPPPPPTGPRVPQSTQDTDQDKLTDLEEDVYNTDPSRPDTDGDGHLDGSEVMSLFDPLRPAPAMLESSNTAIVFRNERWAYNITHPAKWVARPIDAEQREVMFTSATGAFVEVLIQDNPGKLPVAEWYASQSGGFSTSQLETFTTKRGTRGVKSIDGLTVYLAPDQPDPGTIIYTVTYNEGVATAYNFLSSWQMMINSFNVTRVISEPPGSSPPAPGEAPPPPPPTSNQNSNINVGG